MSGHQLSGYQHIVIWGIIEPILIFVHGQTIVACLLNCFVFIFFNLSNKKNMLSLLSCFPQNCWFEDITPWLNTQ